MEKKGLRKLQLTRETLRNLSTDELSRVVGGTYSDYCSVNSDCCAETVLPCNQDPLPSAVSCGCPSDGCNSGYSCTTCNATCGGC
jgi:hypothetical protein